MSLVARSPAAPADSEYRKLLAALTRRAVRIGAYDPEGAAHEAIKRSLVNPTSREALEYYFHDPTIPISVPAWSLLQLFGWLHGVLRYVVLEERSRRAREVPAPDGLPDTVDSQRDPLQHVLDAEVDSVVREALHTLSRDQRSALLLRLKGAKYSDIAATLGVNENTVATWIRRGSQAVVSHVHRRMNLTPAARTIVSTAGVSNG
jgi:DNA-binding CsgD family transcriptional regulator